MPMPAHKPATTPIPVQLSEAEFTAFILPHLSMPKRGPTCNLGYHRVFNLILWVLYTGMRDLSRERESSEQFVWLNRRYGETGTQLSRSAIPPSIRTDSSQNEGI